MTNLIIGHILDFTHLARVEIQLDILFRNKHMIDFIFSPCVVTRSTVVRIQNVYKVISGPCTFRNAKFMVQLPNSSPRCHSCKG